MVFREEHACTCVSLVVFRLAPVFSLEVVAYTRWITYNYIRRHDRTTTTFVSLRECGIQCTVIRMCCYSADGPSIRLHVPAIDSDVLLV